MCLLAAFGALVVLVVILLGSHLLLLSCPFLAAAAAEHDAVHGAGFFCKACIIVHTPPVPQTYLSVLLCDDLHPTPSHRFVPAEARSSDSPPLGQAGSGSGSNDDSTVSSTRRLRAETFFFNTHFPPHFFPALKKEIFVLRFSSFPPPEYFGGFVDSECFMPRSVFYS